MRRGRGGDTIHVGVGRKGFVFWWQRWVGGVKKDINSLIRIFILINVRSVFVLLLCVQYGTKLLRKGGLHTYVFGWRVAGVKRRRRSRL